MVCGVWAKAWENLFFSSFFGYFKLQLVVKKSKLPKAKRIIKILLDYCIEQE